MLSLFRSRFLSSSSFLSLSSFTLPSSSQSSFGMSPFSSLSSHSLLYQTKTTAPFSPFSPSSPFISKRERERENILFQPIRKLSQQAKRTEELCFFPVDGKSVVKGSEKIPLLKETIGDFFDQQVSKYSDRHVLHVPYQNISWTWKQLQEKVNECAFGLFQRGFKRGDRVACWMPNCSEWLVLQLAAAKIGVILVNLNTNYTPLELSFALSDVGCSGLVMMDRYKTSNYCEILEEAFPDVQEAKNGALSSPNCPLKHILVVAKNPEELSDRYELFSKVYQTPSSNLNEFEDAVNQVQENDPINIQFTSGTTGSPKGATLTHSNILNNGFFVGENLQVTENDVFIVPVPLFHCFGMVLGNLAALTHGSALVYPSEIFNPLATLQAAEKYQGTVLHGVPTMFIKMLEAYDKQKDLKLNIRTGIMAGAVCPIEVLRRVRNDFGMEEVTVCYGMTETSPVSFQTVIGAPEEKQVTTVGTVLPQTEARIVNEDGEIVSFNEPGELHTKGYLVMKGYFGAPQKTASVITEDGWMKTGDLASMDSQGYVKIVGRLKDIIIRGGENIYPTEIEDVLHSHPEIEDVSVLGVPCEIMGEEVCVWVNRSSSSSIDEKNIKDFCAGKLSKYKIPKHVHITDNFPVTANGKHQKNIMREKSLEIFNLKKQKN